MPSRRAIGRLGAWRRRFWPFGEARLSALLHHGHIARVLDFGISDDTHYLTLGLIEGTDLRAVLRHLRSRGESLDPGLTSFIAHALTQLLNWAERLICLLSVSGKKAFVAAISLSVRGEPHVSRWIRSHNAHRATHARAATSGHSIKAIQAQLGHQSAQSTHLYAHLGDEAQLRLVEALRPVSPPHVNLRSTAPDRQNR